MTQAPDIPKQKTPFKNFLNASAWIVLGLNCLTSNAETFSIVEPKPISELWLNPGAYSYHFQREKGLNNNNYGLGAEYRYSTVGSVMIGGFHNSYRYTSHYVVWHWQPLAFGPFRFGAVAGGIDGYPKMLDGGWFFAVIPTVGIAYKNFGASLFVVPSYQNRLYGAISLQFDLRVF